MARWPIQSPCAGWLNVEGILVGSVEEAGTACDTLPDGLETGVALMTTVRPTRERALSSHVGRERPRIETLAELLPANVDTVSPVVDELPGVG